MHCHKIRFVVIFDGMDKVSEVLTRGIENILPNKDGLERLMHGNKIRVYLGVDPTGSKLHLGHTIPMRKLQEFANLRHEAILLFGTGTVLAGDPSQRAQIRTKITQEEIDENIKTWKSQAQKIINFNKVKIKYNGDWLLKLNLVDILNIASNLSAIQLFKRDMFQERIERGDTVWLHEMLYPMLQGYDSVVMDVDLEIGGTDQTFNMLVGRELQKKMNNRKKFVLTTPLISGTNGKPMSKTSGNCIWLDDSPQDMYGKIMSMADSQIGEYWQNLTDFDPQELISLKPLNAKKKLAFEIVKIYHGENTAQEANNQFESIYQKGVLDKSVPDVITKTQELLEFLITQVPSTSIAKRLLSQGAIEIDGDVVKDAKTILKSGQVVRIGKKKFVRIEVR